MLLAGLSWAGSGDAKRLFHEGQRQQQEGKLAEAFESFRRAAQMDPRDPLYVLHREIARQQLAFRHVNAGMHFMRRKQFGDAVRELERAAEVDPSNEFAKQELQRAREAAGVAERREEFVPPRMVRAPDLEPPLALRPRPGRRDWDLRGDARALYLAVGGAYGIQFQFDDSLPQVTARFRMQDADFATVLQVLPAITKTFVAPLDERNAIVSADTQDKRREFERLVVQTFPANELSTPQELNEVANSIRVLLDLPQVQINTQQKSITVRGPASKVRVAQHMINTLAVGASEVFLEVEVLEVHSRRARELGLLAPLQSSLVKLTADQTKVQTGVAVPLNQAFGREPQTAGTAISQGMAAFGGGRTAFAITLPGASFRATLSESLVRSISTQSVRAVDNLPSTLLVGERYPIVNATFSPIFFSGDVQQQAQQGTLVNPFPSFTFEDLGIRLRMTPRIHNDGEISLKIEAQVRSLTGQTLNSVPTISNRQTEQVVRVREGQAAMISGVLLQDERSTMNGWPLLSEIPVLGYLFGQRSREVAESEVIVLLTPHVLHDPAGAWPGRTSIAMPSVYVPVAPL